MTCSVGQLSEKKLSNDTGTRGSPFLGFLTVSQIVLENIQIFLNSCRKLRKNISTRVVWPLLKMGL